MQQVPVITIVVVIFAIIILSNAIKVLREYERGVVFRLGRLIRAKGPGIILLIPIVDRMVRVSLRTVVLDVPPQDVITQDNVLNQGECRCLFPCDRSPKSHRAG
jgi:regulator of protease activity HflC (stomatin/prohibitin superfamily)